MGRSKLCKSCAWSMHLGQASCQQVEYHPDEENLSGWIKAGVHCVGMGSQLMAKDNAGNFDYNGITQKTLSAIDIIKKLRKIIFA